MQFVNRLSDLFFTMARYEMFARGMRRNVGSRFCISGKAGQYLMMHKRSVHIFCEYWENIVYLYANTRTICLLHSKKHICVTFMKGKTDNKNPRYQPDVIRRYQKCIDFLLDAKEGRRTSFDKFLEL